LNGDLFCVLSSHLLSKNLQIKVYKTIILPVILYGCETSFLTLREEHRLRVFGNRVLRRTFGPKREKIAGGWRRLHNEELHKLRTSTNIVRVITLVKMKGVGHQEYTWGFEKFIQNCGQKT
jgi:hypothetical protein